MRYDSGRAGLVLSSSVLGLRYEFALLRHSMGHCRFGDDGLYHSGGFGNRLVRITHIFSCSGSSHVPYPRRTARLGVRSALSLTSDAPRVCKTVWGRRSRVRQLISGCVFQDDVTSDEVHRLGWDSARKLLSIQLE